MASFNNSTNSTAANTTCPVCGDTLSINENGTFKKCFSCGYTETHSLGSPDFSQLLRDANHQLTTHKSTDEKNSSIEHHGLYGWICPKCGSVMSPFTSCCPNCTKHNFEITCTTSSIVANGSGYEAKLNEPITAFNDNYSNVNDFCD